MSSFVAELMMYGILFCIELLLQPKLLKMTLSGQKCVTNVLIWKKWLKNGLNIKVWRPHPFCLLLLKAFVCQAKARLIQAFQLLMRLWRNSSSAITNTVNSENCFADLACLTKTADLPS